MAAFSSNQHFRAISFSSWATLNPAVVYKLATGFGVRENGWQYPWVCKELCIIQSIISMQQPLKVALTEQQSKTLSVRWEASRKKLEGKLQGKSLSAALQSFPHMVNKYYRKCNYFYFSTNKGLFTKHFLVCWNLHECKWINHKTLGLFFEKSVI